MRGGSDRVLIIHVESMHATWKFGIDLPFAASHKAPNGNCTQPVGSRVDAEGGEGLMLGLFGQSSLTLGLMSSLIRSRRVVLGWYVTQTWRRNEIDDMCESGTTLLRREW